MLYALEVLLPEFEKNFIQRFDKIIGIRFFQGYNISVFHSNFNMNFLETKTL